MKRWIGITSLGAAVRDTTTTTQPVQDGVYFIEVDLLQSIDIATEYWDGNGFTHKGVQPSVHHVFNYTTKQWVANPEAAWASVRQRRSVLLSESDWLVSRATETQQPIPAAWLTYRQALRDITLQSDPWAMVWPASPD